MTFSPSLSRSLLSACMVACFAASAVADAQVRHYSAHSDDAHGPQKLVDKSASVVEEMDRESDIGPLMRRAVGMYIIPEYGRAGFIIGGKGGAGVVVARKRNGGWSSPAFFNTGGLSVGAQIGAAGGSVVYLLLDRKAVDALRSRNKIALDAHAGLSIVTYSDAVHASLLKGDAVLWTNIKGVYAGATDIHVDGERTRAFYGRNVNVNALLDGKVTAPGGRALDRVLPL